MKWFDNIQLSISDVCVRAPAPNNFFRIIVSENENLNKYFSLFSYLIFTKIVQICLKRIFITILKFYKNSFFIVLFKMIILIVATIEVAFFGNFDIRKRFNCSFKSQFFKLISSQITEY